MNIFDIPLYYIGFTKNIEFENSLKKVGFKHINYFKAIDGRKMTPDELLNNNIISVRGYKDLTQGREEHYGLSSLGTVGCWLSHISLWDKCAKELPYIIIVEDDLILNKITQQSNKDIQNALLNGGMFVSASVEKNKRVQGLHLYFLSKNAAINLLTKAMPIDMQTDAYVGNMNDAGIVNVEGYNISNTKYRQSTTGDQCFKCFLPGKKIYYIIILVFMIILVLSCMMIFRKSNKCKIDLDKCRIKCR
jgi:hypothetical protein